jgi:Tfp pilus assembly protein PilO
MKLELPALEPLKEKTRRFIADFDVRERAGVIATVLLAWLGLSLAVAFLINVPRANEVSQLTADLQHLRREINAKSADVEDLRPQHDRVLRGDSDLNIWYDEVLSTKEKRLISFQKELRQISAKFNINMDAVTYPREQLPNRVTKMGAAMPLTGSYENLRAFLKTIESSENFIVIESIQLANAREGGVILSLTILLSTYFVDPDAPDKSFEPGRAG